MRELDRRGPEGQGDVPTEAGVPPKAGGEGQPIHGERIGVTLRFIQSGALCPAQISAGPRSRRRTESSQPSTAASSRVAGQPNALRRRSQKDKTPWTDMDRLANRSLPKPRISHPWPAQRFRVKHPSWGPYAGMPHVRFYAGRAQ